MPIPSLFKAASLLVLLLSGAKATDNAQQGTVAVTQKWEFYNNPYDLTFCRVEDCVGANAFYMDEMPAQNCDTFKDELKSREEALGKLKDEMNRIEKLIAENKRAFLMLDAQARIGYVPCPK